MTAGVDVGGVGVGGRGWERCSQIERRRRGTGRRSSGGS
jgi:hypothetical protein